MAKGYFYMYSTSEDSRNRRIINKKRYIGIWLFTSDRKGTPLITPYDSLMTAAILESFGI